MKNDSGKTKAILITIISILVVALIAVLVVFKFKGSKNNENKNGSTGVGDYTSTMSFIEEVDNEYVFIDSNGNLRKLKKDKVGSLGSVNSGTTYYQNSLVVKKDDKDVVIDFSGNTVFESKSIDCLVREEDSVLYSYRDENGKYGVKNASGEVVVEPTDDELFHRLEGNSKIDSYFYVTGYSSSGTGYAINIYDKYGKKVYTGETESTSLHGNECGVTRTGVNLLVLRKSKTAVSIVNLTTGSDIATLTDNNDHTFEIDIKGNVAVLTSYKRGTYGANEGDEVTRYVWFDENGKIAKIINKSESDYLYFWNGSEFEDYTMYKNAANEEIAIDKYGKEVYKSTKSLSQAYYTNKVTGKTNSIILESQGGKKYHTISSEGKVLLETGATVGSKYLYSEKTLYNLDGSKYMDNVKSYKCVYGLNIITTDDKVIIENEEGKSVEKAADFKLEGDFSLISDKVAVAYSSKDKKVTIINMEDLSMKDLDFNGAEYVFIEKGYISVSSKQDGYTYYNANGDKIYSSKK